MDVVRSGDVSPAERLPKSRFGGEMASSQGAQRAWPVMGIPIASPEIAIRATAIAMHPRPIAISGREIAIGPKCKAIAAPRARPQREPEAALQLTESGDGGEPHFRDCTEERGNGDGASPPGGGRHLAQAVFSSYGSDPGPTGVPLIRGRALSEALELP